ncbi:hypothetical protein ABZ484_34435, partial [Streptomyces sp. NPDC006393]|uniref:hypothetical protein n=1 Tax=Streptomyces sp. NPDC006393 TaxID=3156763 RepID=UPI0033D9091A
MRVAAAPTRAALRHDCPQLRGHGTARSYRGAALPAATTTAAADAARHHGPAPARRRERGVGVGR